MKNLQSYAWKPGFPSIEAENPYRRGLLLKENPDSKKSVTSGDKIIQDFERENTDAYSYFCNMFEKKWTIGLNFDGFIKWQRF